MKNYNYALLSGGFDPVHVGHLAMIKEANEIAEEVVILLNSDKWLKRKNISDMEMLRTFNCGVGFCVVIDPKKRRIK